MPVTITRPWLSRQTVQARAKLASSRGISAAMARPSISRATSARGDEGRRIILEARIHAGIIPLDR